MQTGEKLIHKFKVILNAVSPPSHKRSSEVEMGKDKEGAARHSEIDLGMAAAVLMVYLL